MTVPNTGAMAANYEEVSVVADSLKSESVASQARPLGGLPLRRREWIAILLFVALNVAVPLLKVEVYPLSRFPCLLVCPGKLLSTE